MSKQVGGSTVINPELVRREFPIFGNQGKPLIYLDSAASSQKPQVVIDAMRHYYEHDNANVHRGVYDLAERATEAYEVARQRVARFFNAPESSIIFTRNTTEAINLVARTWADANLKPGDAIVLSEMEHHSNIVPWQLAAQRTGAELRYVELTADGRIDLDSLQTLLAAGGVKLVTFCHVSNMLGTINPASEIVEMAHNAGALAMLDGAQAAPHLPIDVRALDVDFYAASAHKMCGPMGAGALYGKRELLEAMPPFLGGGDMIRDVGLFETTWADLPSKFEAGTPSVADAVGFGVACEYLAELGMDAVAAHEHALTEYAYHQLREIPGLEIYGPAPEHRSGAISFNIAAAHPHDVASILNDSGVCIRAGHHCTQPLHRKLDITASARASFYVYNDQQDVERLIEALQQVQTIFGN